MPSAVLPLRPALTLVCGDEWTLIASIPIGRPILKNLSNRTVFGNCLSIIDVEEISNMLVGALPAPSSRSFNGISPGPLLHQDSAYPFVHLDVRVQ